MSTSDTLPSTSTTQVSGPTNALNTFAQPSGFFANRGAVAGVFVVVGLVVLGLAALLFFGWKRYCRRSRSGYTTEPTSPNIEPSYNNDTHYRRASQMLALGDVLSAGASRPLSGHSVPSEDSHTFSRLSHHSTDPIVPPLAFPEQHADTGPSQGYSEGHTDGYKSLIPFPPPAKLFFGQSQVSVQSAAESSPSIYPPTLPSVAEEEEEHYWRRQGFEHVSDLQESNGIGEKHTMQQQPTPPDSMLGLWSDVSHSIFQHHSVSEENELIRSLDPRMEPTSVHKGTTAPIASPPRLQLQDGRYPIGPHRRAQ
ncbi:hypothetical protein JB92DRAFT_321872 [Gautieria morchelliformis]|nr:hypothetical protein JB92DRAFT_321872 [Gautieria morchelliformis]